MNAHCLSSSLPPARSAGPRRGPPPDVRPLAVAPPAEGARPGATGSDYARVERAIRFLDEHAAERPRLEDVAASVGLSPFHFQRLFCRWAGVSPKRFLQAHAFGHARRLLAERRSVLDTAYEVGLSGPGRLHDLFVTIEAATPGEVSAGGAGLRVAYGAHESPFGPYLLGLTARGVCALSFFDAGGFAGALEALRADWPRATHAHAPRETAPVAAEIFSTAPRAAPAPLQVFLKGTGFQLQVWRALLRIAPGAVATYGDVAAALGRPRAGRAVGGAVGDNPVGFVIPCHRVLRQTGVGDYRWGPERKRAMLAWEALRGE